VIAEVRSFIEPDDGRAFSHRTFTAIDRFQRLQVDRINRRADLHSVIARAANRLLARKKSNCRIARLAPNGYYAERMIANQAFMLGK
jgi:hypothetical protein